MSEHQDPPEPLTFLQQSDSKPFSIREYVYASRQKDIFLSWPFLEKHLHMFLDNGIKTVLPPFEPNHLAFQSLCGHAKRVNGCDSKARHDSNTKNEEKNLNVGGNSSDQSDETDPVIYSQEDFRQLLNLSGTKPSEEDQNGRCFTGHQCKEVVDSKRRVTAKHRKKSTVDTSQNLQRLTSSSYCLRRREPRGFTKNGKCKSELTMAECDGAAIDVLSAKKWALKFKFRGRDSRNSRNRTLTGKEISFLRRHN